METVKLTEPTYGRIVTLQILRKEPFLLDMSIWIGYNKLDKKDKDMLK